MRHSLLNTLKSLQFIKKISINLNQCSNTPQYCPPFSTTGIFQLTDRFFWVIYITPNSKLKFPFEVVLLIITPNIYRPFGKSSGLYIAAGGTIGEKQMVKKESLWRGSIRSNNNILLICHFPYSLYAMLSSTKAFCQSANEHVLYLFWHNAHVRHVSEPIIRTCFRTYKDMIEFLGHDAPTKTYSW